MIILPRKLTVAITNRPMGLSASDYADVVQAVHRLAGVWSVEQDMDDCDQTSVSILQEDALDEDSVAFLLWSEHGLYRVGFGQGDFYADLGSHRSLEGAMMAVKCAVEGSDAMSTWMEELHFPFTGGC